MPKRTQIKARSKAQKSADEKLFLKLIENEAKKTKRKQSRKKTSTKVRTGNLQTDSARKEKRKTTKQGIVKKGKKHIPKSATKNKTDVSKKLTGDGRKTVTKRIEKTRVGKLITEARKRGKEQTDFHFSGVRNVNKKINLFKGHSAEGIKKQLKRKGGKPPKGIIVTVFDKKNREHTRISALDFVVNLKSTQKFVTDMLQDMSDDFMEWIDMDGEPGDDSDSNPYADYNPDTISTISIKYIY